jgi:hypothetical protein
VVLHWLELDVVVVVSSFVVVSGVVVGSPLSPVSTSASAPAATANTISGNSSKARKPPSGPPKMSNPPRRGLL